MARFMPAACSPCAIDQAIERLLATPNTTALRLLKSTDMCAPYEWERIATDTENDHRHESPLVRLKETQSAAISLATSAPTGQLEATNDKAYTQPRIPNATTRLTFCATAPTTIASTSCRKVPAK